MKETLQDNSIKLPPLLLRDSILWMMKEAVKALYPDISAEVGIEQPKDPTHGHYASTIALSLAKELGKNPQEIADAIIKKVKKIPAIAELTTAGPGFINITLSPVWLAAEISKKARLRGYRTLRLGSKQPVIVEYSQPNVAKPLGVHHLLSTIIGDSLYNIYKMLGYKAIAINHIGDWGTQFGKLLYAYKKWGDKKVIDKDPLNELLKLYVRFHDEAKIHPELEDFGREEFKNLECGDQENRKLWQWFTRVSMEEVGKLYKRLNIRFDYILGESFYEDKMGAILAEGINKHIFVPGETEGSLVAKFPGDRLPTYLIRKSDGATLYATRDLATIKYRVQTWHPFRIIYVVDMAQSLYFQQLFATAEMLGWRDTELSHVSFGRMSFKDGKMSTREGKVILMDQVLDEAVTRARAVVKEKSPELSAEEQAQVAEAIGIGGIKWVILSQNRTTNIAFDWDKMLALDGNSAPYMQYTYARAAAILRKAGSKREAMVKGTGFQEPEAINLAAVLMKFPEVLQDAAEEYKPNLLTNYLFALAQHFNTFYHKLPVLKAEDPVLRSMRLKLVKATATTLRAGLGLCGIEVVERM